MTNQEKNTSSNYEAFDEKKLDSLRDERQEHLKNTLERGIEKDTGDKLESARKEALEQATRLEKEQRTAEKQASPAERRGPITSKEKEASFEATMTEIRTHMSGPSRTFSRLIHNKTVEKVSDTVGATIARPNAIVSGSAFAFIATLAIYLVANHNGYALSGSETIASFAFGWVLGLIFDYIRVLVLGKSR